MSLETEFLMSVWNNLKRLFDPSWILICFAWGCGTANSSVLNVSYSLIVNKMWPRQPSRY